MSGPISCNKESNDFELPLLGLPAECRELIYSELFHEDRDPPCVTHLARLGDAGCWCGEALSRASKKLYSETRRRHYKCVRFIFVNPVACELFLRRLGQGTEWITSLQITSTNSVMDSSRLRAIFASVSNLRHLKMLYERDTPFELTPQPLYLPSISSNKEMQAIAYDLLLRPSRHPLSKLESMTSLTIIGWPCVEMEEAFYKLSVRMKEHAKREGRRVEETEKAILWEPYPGRKWLYRLEIRGERAIIGWPNELVLVA